MIKLISVEFERDKLMALINQLEKLPEFSDPHMGWENYEMMQQLKDALVSGGSGTYNEGYSEGYDVGQDEGYDAGKDEAESDSASAYTEGFDDGKAAGRKEALEMVALIIKDELNEV